VEQKTEKYPVQGFLTPYQVVQFTAASFLPTLFWVFPRFAVVHGDYDAQWAVLLLVLVGFVIAWVQGRLNHRFPEDTGIDYLAIVYGKWIGKTLGFFYVAIYLLFVAIGMRMFVFLVGALYMPNTPPFVLICLFLGVAVYGSRLGIETLARISSLFNPLVILGLIGTFIAAYFEYLPYGLPMKPDRLMMMLSGTYHLMPMIFGFNVYQMLGPYHKKTKRSYLYPLFSVGQNGILVIVAILVTLSMLGWEFVRVVQWSLPFLFRQIYLEGFVIERVGVSMIVISVVYNVIFTANHMWGISLCWARLFNRDRNAYRRFVFPTAVLIGFIAWSFHLENTMENIIGTYLTPISWVVLLVIPMMTLMLAAIRKKGKPGPPKENKEDKQEKSDKKVQKSTKKKTERKKTG
jgi:hypothetical protein